ncbi:MAG TPA: hypothetical protein VES88_17205 [Gemmatimonadaceae bacterium]|nr:hypothetical protein [Gemmatimonadaceae bacterium]
MAGALLLSSCAPEPTDPATTDISGVWTSDAHIFALSQIKLELLGAGKFEGMLIEPNRLRGILAVGTGYEAITFVK